MNPRQTLSAAGLATLEQLEGYVPVARHLPGDRPSVITGGFGDTQVVNGETHSRDEWEARLRARVRMMEMLVNSGLLRPIPPPCFDACVLFIYNVGPGDPKSNPVSEGFLTSALRRKINLGDLAGAAEEFKRWNHANGQICPGLTRRRLVEENLFRTGLVHETPKAA